MAKRTITNDEIALIKAMVARGMKNRDIQFFFNRPDRAVNSGRITDIASGAYSDSASIPVASDKDLDAFFATQKPSSSVPLVVAPGTAAPSSPLSEVTLQQMFAKGSGGIWYLAAGETDQAECKKSFGLKHTAPWLKAVAALANNRGGYVFLGVGDKDPKGAHPVLGLPNDEFADLDPAEIAKRLRSTFDPTPRFQKAVFKVGGKTVGVLHVEQHPSRPVIACKNEGQGDIREGDIFFRYPGQSTRISYSDLRAMLDERDAQARAEMLPMIQRLLALGPERAMVADLREGSLLDGKRTIELDPDVIKELKFIKEGDFDEKAGAPALRLIGDIQASASAGAKKGLVTRADMRKDFLSEALTADPIDYVRCAIEVPGNDWLPIRYFGRRAKMSDAELIGFVQANEKATKAQKKLYVTRLSSPDAAYVAAAGPAQDVLARLSAGEDVTPDDVAQARLVALAIQGLTRPLAVSPTKIRPILITCCELIEAGSDAFAKTAIRKAIARLDELSA